MNSADGKLTALFSAWVPGLKTLIQAARLRNGRMMPIGPPISLDGQFVAKLGRATEDVRGDRIDVGIQAAIGSGKRWVATLQGNGWSSTDLIPNNEQGLALSGPVRTNDFMILPVVEEHMETGNWPLLAYRWSNDQWSQVGEGPINRGPGAAQGGLDVVGNEVWMTWNQMGPNPPGQFGQWIPTKEWAARLDDTGTKIVERIRLWSGKAYWPPQTQAVEYRGGPVFLYMRQPRPKGGLHTTVDFSHR